MPARAATSAALPGGQYSTVIGCRRPGNTCTVGETERRDGDRETETETETRGKREGQRDMKKREATWDLHHRRVEELREEVHIDSRRHEHHAKIRCSR